MSDVETPGYEEKRAELIQDAKQKKQELDQKQNEALAAIKEGDDFSGETVELGELEIEVRTSIPPELEDKIREAESEIDEENPEMEGEAVELNVEIMARLTEDETYNESFWYAFYDEHGSIGLMIAAERIMSPAIEKMESVQEGVESFRPESRGQSPSTRMRNAERPTE